MKGNRKVRGKHNVSDGHRRQGIAVPHTVVIKGIWQRVAAGPSVPDAGARCELHFCIVHSVLFCRKLLRLLQNTSRQ